MHFAIAQAKEFVDKKKGRLDYMIEQGGKNLRNTVLHAVDQLDHSHCGRMYHSGITLCCVIHSKENIQYVQEAG